MRRGNHVMGRDGRVIGGKAKEEKTQKSLLSVRKPKGSDHGNLKGVTEKMGGPEIGGGEVHIHVHHHMHKGAKAPKHRMKR